MSGPRLWRANALIVGLLVASLWTLATDQEHWPISVYGMFSETRRAPELTTLELWGLPAGGSGAEVAVNRPDELAPMDPDRLTASFTRMAASGPESGDLAAALADCRARANRYRVRHGELALEELRLYAVHRTIRIASAGPDAIDARRLVAAVREPADP